MTPALRARGLRKSFEVGTCAVDGVDLDIEAGEFFCLLGPSGCGKSTLLRLLGGYEVQNAGTIELHSRDVSNTPPDARAIGMVFQDYALFPHMSGRENVAFGLEARRVPKAERTARVDRVLDRVRIDLETAQRKPRAMSGGQQQRIALARALVLEPTVLMLDEPFSNLDRHLREDLRNELRALQRRLGLTTLLVTHDQDEALSLGDRIAVMSSGRVVQAGTPSDVYARPVSAFVARFLGVANLLPLPAHGATDGRASPAEHEYALTTALAARPATEDDSKYDRLLIRPEHVHIGAAASGCAVRVNARVIEVAFHGSELRVDLLLESGRRLLACSPVSDGGLRTGDEVRLGINTQARWIVPPDAPSASTSP